MAETTSDLHHPDRPEGVPILGLSLSERARDFWDDLGSSDTLRGKTGDRNRFPTDVDKTCMDLLPGRATCGRREGHSGRHLALLRSRDGAALNACSAWPGTHRPNVSDLE